MPNETKESTQIFCLRSDLRDALAKKNQHGATLYRSRATAKIGLDGS
jgi:hypothetical protein